MRAGHLDAESTEISISQRSRSRRIAPTDFAASISACLEPRKELLRTVQINFSLFSPILETFFVLNQTSFPSDFSADI